MTKQDAKRRVVLYKYHKDQFGHINQQLKKTGREAPYYMDIFSEPPLHKDNNSDKTETEEVINCEQPQPPGEK